ncbi:SIR2 family protein [Oerskovia sp. NPDC057915]|uniref:P-loop NTPase n=1 Tax=Oerskovia sp. NPDC057915 TaxID=3346280 RepID=UPI0036DADFB1
MPIGNEADLIARLRSIYRNGDETRSLSILCGSGITSSVIASPAHIVEMTRKGLHSEDRQDLDSALADIVDDAEKYRATFDFLALRREPGYRDRVIQLATLGAYKGLDSQQTPTLTAEALTTYENDEESWKLPIGVESLGRIWAGTANIKRGPILTSNFDPLCEIAIRRAGGTPVTNVLDTDGAFLRDVRVSSEPHIVHFHGYWRGQATLSMANQLSQSRPALGASLRTVLRRNTLLVIGYGGWSDALTAKMVEIIGEQDSTVLDILWCHFGDVADLNNQIAANPVLQSLSNAPGNVQFYAKIDSDTLFPKLERALSEHLAYPDDSRTKNPGGGLIGWQIVDGKPISRDHAIEKSAALSFFDGRLPNWGDAASPLIPLRDVSASCINQIKRAISNRTPSMSLLLGPSGEGKSTALMQIAAALARERKAGAMVMYHPDGGLAAADEVLALPPGREYILVLDEASKCVDRLRDLVRRANEVGRKNIHLVLAARSTDWRNSGGAGFSWRQHIGFFDHSISGMTRNDAVSVVDAWSRIGESALGELRQIPTREDRIQQLLRAARDGQAAGEGAFLGALLTTRYGNGFRDHVVELMRRLANWEVLSEERTSTLLDAFAAIALPHSLNIRTLSPSVLAGALGVSVDELYHEVLVKLGDEAAVTYSREAVLVRHSMIARTAIDAATDGGIILADTVARLVRSSVEQIEFTGPRADLLEIAYLSRKIDDPKLAVVAAEVAASTAPMRLSYKSSLSKALRRANRYPDACEVGETALAQLSAAPDLSTAGRPFFTEWGIAEGHASRWARNASLAGVALADNFNLGALRGDQAMVALYCLSFAFRRLSEDRNSAVFANAALAVFEITASERLDKNADWTDDLNLWLRGNGVRSKLAGAAAMEAITEALSVADSLLEAPFLHMLPGNSRRFSELNTLASW